MKAIVLATAAATLLATTFSSSLAHAGEGRNGPDRTGTSIPVKVDRLIDVDTFAKVVSDCSTKQLALIAQQILKANPTNPSSASGDLVNKAFNLRTHRLSTNSDSSEVFYFQQGDNTFLTPKFDRNDQNGIAYSTHAVSPEVYDALQRMHEYGRWFEMNLTAKETIASQPRYDDFGQPAAQVISGYTINADSTVMMKEPASLNIDLPLPNHSVKTAFQTYPEGFRQCIAQGLK